MNETDWSIQQIEGETYMVVRDGSMRSIGTYAQCEAFVRQELRGQQGPRVTLKRDGFVDHLITIPDENPAPLPDEYGQW